VNKPLTTALAIAATAIVGAGVVGGVASATTDSRPTSTSQALAKLDQAKQLINEAENILRNQQTSSPPSTVTTSPTSTNNAPPPVTTSGSAAANWGTPNAQYSDEFNTPGDPDPKKWFNSAPGCMEGNAGNGKRCPENAQVSAEGFLRETGDANGNTGWLASQLGQKYGRYEVRARISNPEGSGKKYHPVLLLWPDSNKWPQDGEYDFFEVNSGDTNAQAFLHHPDGSPQDHFTSPDMDLTQWHNYAFEWTAQSLTGWIDGKQWFTTTSSAAQAPGKMHATIQLDNNNGSGMAPATMDVDWFHVYPVS
jgi:hypothetical protein